MRIIQCVSTVRVTTHQAKLIGGRYMASVVYVRKGRQFNKSGHLLPIGRGRCGINYRAVGPCAGSIKKLLTTSASVLLKYFS